MINELKSHKSFAGKTQFWEHDSSATKTKMKFSTFMPHQGVRSCLIWLSGLTCTDENFITKSFVQSHLAETQTMVICPDTSPRGLQLKGEHDSYDFGSGAGFYVNATEAPYDQNYQMYDYVVKELYHIIQEKFGVSDRVSIFGHSMGGHGALVIGLREPNKFKSVSAFSPITNPTQCPWGQKALAGYLGDNAAAWRQYDACELLKAKIEENAIDYNDVTTIYEQRTYVVTHVTTTVVSCTIGDINTVCPQTSIESEIVDKAEYDSHSGSKHINKRYYLALNSGETTEVSEGRFLRAIDHLTYVTNNNFSAFEDDEGLVTYSGHMDAGEELATSGIEEN